MNDCLKESPAIGLTVRYMHEVWEDPDDSSVMFVCVAAPWADLNRGHLSPKATIIGTFEAGSLAEARTLFNRFMDWDEYEPSELDDADPYPDEWAQNSN